MRLINKTKITGEIEVLTGLHIGGSSTSMKIGETDLSVIKSPRNGEPIIPGSSLKGKLRGLLAKIDGKTKPEDDIDEVKTIFGCPKDNNGQEFITRLIVRDCYLTNADKLQEWEMENPFTETKWENTINRSKGGAEHPRQLERVPKGAIFHFEMILDVYDVDVEEGKSESKYLPIIRKAINLLEDDYLGGSGTRGYGKIKFDDINTEIKVIEDYVQKSN